MPGPHQVSGSLDILVVDEGDATATHLARLLAQEGVALRHARSQSEALLSLERRRPDALITDVRVGDGTGFELVDKVRRLPGGDALPVLMLSPLAAFPDKVEAIHCGADGYFEEPIDWESLWRRLQHLLERGRRHPSRVLCVEEDESQADALQTVLASAGHHVRVCYDPLRFEAELLAFDPDLVVMNADTHGGVSGYDLVRYLRQSEQHAMLPVVLLGSADEQHDRIRSVVAGGDEHIPKPVSVPLLLSAVAARLERASFFKGLLERDGLTRLLRHTAFLQRATVAISVKQRNPRRSFVWVMMDLDHFKDVNDRHGHPVGDRVLTSLAGLLRRRLRQSDTIGRYGGEEFAILFEELGEGEAVRLVSRLLVEFRALPHPAPDGSSFHVTFSAGVAALKPEMSLDAWRQAADDALYTAKAAGRNKVVAAGAATPARSAH